MIILCLPLLFFLETKHFELPCSIYFDHAITVDSKCGYAGHQR